MIIPMDLDNINEADIKIGAELLAKSETIIHPTETVYGFAANYNDSAALNRVIMAKGRKENQPFSIMVPEVKDIFRICGFQSDWLKETLSAIFPAPLTVILPRRRALAIDYWNQFPSLGFRIPKHEFSQLLLKHAGFPIITTSANKSGSDATSSAATVIKDFSQEIPLIYDAGDSGGGTPSTIVKIDPETKIVSLIRSGALSFNIIQKHFALT